jgi:hypothetical protein
MPIKLLYLFLAATAAATQLPAQTKWIAHKSHSGSTAHFAAVTPGSIFDDDGSNFGQAPRIEVKTAQLDSIIWLSDSVVVMVTSQYCKWPHSNSDDLWRAGRDTLLRHELFCAGFSLDEIKRRLKKNYHFRNNINTVAFIGYQPKKQPTPPPTPAPAPKPPVQTPQNQQQQNQQQNQQQGQQGGQNQGSLPVFLTDHDAAPPSGGLPVTWIVVSMAFFALIAGLISWKISRARTHEKLV